MFGYHDIPLKIVEGEISLSVEREGEHLLYRRECGNEKVEKTLLMSSGKVLINPIEPLHKPKEVTTKLMIELERSLVVEPKVVRKVFLTFPVEIGVFIYGKNRYDILDIMTLARQKLTLYGEIKRGVVQVEGHICKYWKSGVNPKIPQVNPLHQGVLELSISNTTQEWHEVTKIVLDAYGMKVFYNENLVSMRAQMKVLSEKVAETSFINSPLIEGMKRSMELYTAKKIPVMATKFVMEAGI